MPHRGCSSRKGAGNIQLIALTALNPIISTVKFQVYAKAPAAAEPEKKKVSQKKLKRQKLQMDRSEGAM
jgi:hypothetical protein